MVCPKCGADIDDDCEKCMNCSMDFKHIDSNEKNTSFEAKKPQSNKKPDKVKLIKAMVMLIIGLIIVIVGVFIIKAAFGNSGEKIAAKLSEKIGTEIVVAEKYAKIHLSPKSKSNAINKLGDFDYIYESDKLIKIDGIKVPKWAIKVVMKDDEVFSVYYRDYSKQKKSYKGEKIKKSVDVSKIQNGMNLIQVKNIFDMQPLSITYFDDSAEYKYMYYFVNEDKDEERDEVVVTFDDEMKVKTFERVDLSVTESTIK